eukprot:gene77-12898_t
MRGSTSCSDVLLVGVGQRPLNRLAQYGMRNGGLNFMQSCTAGGPRTKAFGPPHAVRHAQCSSLEPAPLICTPLHASASGYRASSAPAARVPIVHAATSLGEEGSGDDQRSRFLVVFESDELGAKISKVLAEKLELFASKFCPELAAADKNNSFRSLLGTKESLFSEFQQLSDKKLSPSNANNSIREVKQPAKELNLHLTFRHECMAMGCRDEECTMCQFNPTRACGSNFCKKYLVGDSLKAACGAPVKVDVCTDDGKSYQHDIPGLNFEVNLIDGVMYKDKGGKYVDLGIETLKSCIKTVNLKDEALLQLKCGVSREYRKFLISPKNGSVLLPSLQVSESSEALLTGRKPPFLLLVCAVKNQSGGGAPVDYPGIAPAISDEFVFVRSRILLVRAVKNLSGGGAPVDFPGIAPAISDEFVFVRSRILLVRAVANLSGGYAPVDFPGIAPAISEEFVPLYNQFTPALLLGMLLADMFPPSPFPLGLSGRETVKKLLNLSSSAAEIGLRISSLPSFPNSISTVGHFVALVEMAEEDGQLKKMLQLILKLSKEKWEEAARHALVAVKPDFRRRIWYPPGTLSRGVLFSCKYGLLQASGNGQSVQGCPKLLAIGSPSRAAASFWQWAARSGLLQTSGNGQPVQVYPESVLDPNAHVTLREMKSEAVASWWKPKHPGWGIYKSMDPPSLGVARSLSGHQPQSLAPSLSRLQMDPPARMGARSISLQQQLQPPGSSLFDGRSLVLQQQQPPPGSSPFVNRSLILQQQQPSPGSSPFDGRSISLQEQQQPPGSSPFDGRSLVLQQQQPPPGSSPFDGRSLVLQHPFIPRPQVPLSLCRQVPSSTSTQATPSSLAPGLEPVRIVHNNSQSPSPGFLAFVTGPLSSSTQTQLQASPNFRQGDVPPLPLIRDSVARKLKGIGMHLTNKDQQPPLLSKPESQALGPRLSSRLVHSGQFCESPAGVAPRPLHSSISGLMLCQYWDAGAHSGPDLCSNSGRTPPSGQLFCESQAHQAVFRPAAEKDSFNVYASTKRMAPSRLCNASALKGDSYSAFDGHMLPNVSAFTSFANQAWDASRQASAELGFACNAAPSANSDDSVLLSDASDAVEYSVSHQTPGDWSHLLSDPSDAVEYSVSHQMLGGFIPLLSMLSLANISWFGIGSIGTASPR